MNKTMCHLSAESLAARICRVFLVPRELADSQRLLAITDSGLTELDDWLQSLPHTQTQDLIVPMGIAMFGILQMWPSQPLLGLHLWAQLDVGSFDGKVDLDGFRIHGFEKQQWPERFGLAQSVTKEQAELIMEFLTFVHDNANGTLGSPGGLERMLRFWQRIPEMH